MFAAESKASRLEGEQQRVALEWKSARQPAARAILPNVKDEPRHARRIGGVGWSVERSCEIAAAVWALALATC